MAKEHPQQMCIEKVAEKLGSEEWGSICCFGCLGQIFSATEFQIDAGSYLKFPQEFYTVFGMILHISRSLTPSNLHLIV